MSAIARLIDRIALILFLPIVLGGVLIDTLLYRAPLFDALNEDWRNWLRGWRVAGKGGE